MPKFARMIDVLDLYSESVTLLTAEEVAVRLQVSRPTAFRYMRELCEAGFLANFGGRYSLGARIITLDYRIRASDPLVQQGQEVMRALSDETGCSSVLCRMYNDDIINVHQEAGYGDATLTFFGRGRPLPLFRGSASKAMLAWLPPARLKRLYERYADLSDVRAIAADWTAFRQYFQQVRERGYYFSNQEVDVGTAGIAAPILVPRAGVLGVVSLVFAVERLNLLQADGLAQVLLQHVAHLSERLSPLLEDAPT